MYNSFCMTSTLVYFPNAHYMYEYVSRMIFKPMLRALHYPHLLTLGTEYIVYNDHSSRRRSPGTASTFALSKLDEFHILPNPFSLLRSTVRHHHHLSRLRSSLNYLHHRHHHHLLGESLLHGNLGGMVALCRVVYMSRGSWRFRDGGNCC